MKTSTRRDQKEAKGKTFYKDLNTMSMKQRNGLFSDPISLALGDTYYVPAARKGKNGNVPIKPKNFSTSKMKNGKSDTALFSMPAYNGIGDPYDESWKNLKLRSSKQTSSKPRPFTAGGRAKQRDPTSYLK
mmetsp:Transcript_17671/g.15588  ORF Transcript_17671/g.15588 Transcript_17671/m.15588 type:complete len:131 (+) Transcript_17671:26-418(+)